MYLDNYINQIQELCKQYNVKTLFAFGSVLSERFNDSSDIDFIVDIHSDDPFDYADKYFDLKFSLEKILNRQIDLLENKALKNPYLKINIDNSKTLIYAT